MNSKPFYQYHSDGITFSSQDAVGIKTIYAPLCGVDANGIKSAITPLLSGDIKIDKYYYITKPASREDLRYPLREFFIFIKGKGVISLASENPTDQATVTIGPLWHKVERVYKKEGIELTAVNFVPTSNETVELMRVTVKNISRKAIKFTPTGAIPIFGRSLANKHDHEHVTALLNRVEQTKEGVLVKPTMAFNEKGHKDINSVYFVFGRQDKASGLVGSFPTFESFYGEGGSLREPEAVAKNLEPKKLSQQEADGKEAIGALRFKEITLKPGASVDYIMAVGIALNSQQAKDTFSLFDSQENFERALLANKNFWKDKISSIEFKTGQENFNSWMRWVTLQPILRRIFGCSFLPDHDYGKGGKGWRDIWQDLLSLIFIEPNLVRESLLNNCAGIRIDGSNATIIGTKPGEFIADRNAITRVWMDHGTWPFLTILLYIDQTGDYDLLLEKQTYFKDPQLSRSMEKDLGWISQYGNHLLDKKGLIYHGTILEHLLVQNLVQFFNVGEHNIIRLESADWNDGLDMAFAKGESVAFMSFYGGNLLKIADLIETLGKIKKQTTLHLAKELLILLDSFSAHPINYDHAKEKHEHLFGKYFHNVEPVLSGEMVAVSIADVAKDLRHKAHWIFGQIRRQEKITVDYEGKKYQWFNGYYDNKAQRVEGIKDGNVRMTLTGQVFAIMSGLADSQEIQQITLSVDQFLKDKELGGYRLNTDFGSTHYLDLGRAFGFAYGTKENGAFFSHMVVMYAYALYARGFARKGYEVLQSLYRMATDTKRSKIYPGVPEYFDSQGRGMYHYLTGSASWLVLTQLTQVFGVRGAGGDLLLSPQLLKEEFNAKGVASVTCQFAERTITVEYYNPKKLDVELYGISQVTLNDQLINTGKLSKASIKIQRSQILNVQEAHIRVTLDAIKVSPLINEAK
ncbi:MAG: cellobiose phosphorylase [Candidatus Omnitrophota bacterium]